MDRSGRIPTSASAAVASALCLLALATSATQAAPTDSTDVSVSDLGSTASSDSSTGADEDGVTWLVPKMKGAGFRTPITNFTGASVSDPSVSFDGKRILFSMRQQGARDRSIWKIGADCTGLRQVTSGGGHDFDPLYLPDGKIMFTSSRHGQMDEYNHSPAERLYTCEADGSNLQRVSSNMSDDFGPTLMPDGSIVDTRWDHFGTFNRFPLFVCHPDGTAPFHKFGPHNRNFFHPQPTPDGRLVAIESTRINEDAGPIAVLKLEMGPADPARSDTDLNRDVLTAQVNNDGAPCPYGAFKHPFPLGGNTCVASYTLPAAQEGDVDYGLYTFSLTLTGTGTEQDPASISINDLTFLYNDPDWNEYDAQLRARPDPRVAVPLHPPGRSELQDPLRLYPSGIETLRAGNQRRASPRCR